MNNITNGRKKGCGSCGESQSYESLLLDKPLPTGCFKRKPCSLRADDLSKGNDLPVVQVLDNVLV